MRDQLQARAAEAGERQAEAAGDLLQDHAERHRPERRRRCSEQRQLRALSHDSAQGPSDPADGGERRRDYEHQVAKPGQRDQAEAQPAPSQAQPAEASRAQASRPVKRTQTSRRESDEAKARRIAARYGVYW